MSNFRVSNMAGGLNTLFDPKILGPNKEGDAAETPEVQNMDLTALGAIVTSPGVSLVSSIVASGGTKNLLTYEKDASTRYLLIAHDDDYYSISPSNSAWSSVGDYGTAATNLGGVVYKGTSSIRRAILGNDTTANALKTWDGSTFASIEPKVGEPTISIATPAIISLASHGLEAGDQVYFTTTGALPSGITASTTYYVIAAGLGSSQFEISATLGGAAINTTGSQSGTHSLYSQDVPPKGWIMEEWMGRLFLAQGSSVYYTEVEDQTDWSGGVIGFNDIVTGMIAQGEFLIVYTRREAYAIQMYYNDSFSLSVPLKKPFKNSSGCLAHKTAQRVYNDVYALSVDGVQRFGADPQFIGQGLRINSLSWKINPSITAGALNGSQIERACGAYFNKKYYMAVPDGSDPINSKVYVYNYDFDAWTVRTGIFPSSFAVMADSTGKDELYFGHNTTPELYKFVNSFDYNGAGYNRSFKTKTFTMGDPVQSKFWRYIDIKGAKFLGTKFKVDMTVDGVTKTYEINDDCLETSASGGYYGDNYLGDIYFGGAFGSQFKRYGARLPFPYEIRTGKELTLKFYNSESGQPWSLDFIDIVFDAESPSKVPIIYNNATLTA